MGDIQAIWVLFAFFIVIGTIVVIVWAMTQNRN